MSGWNEPMREWINTLIYAGKIASEQSPQEIAHFAQKIGTNRLISEKIVSWNFFPPFDFTAQFLASRAEARRAIYRFGFQKIGKSSLVRPLGFEPMTISLKGCCSTD